MGNDILLESTFQSIYRPFYLKHFLIVIKDMCYIISVHYYNIADIVSYVNCLI